MAGEKMLRPSESVLVTVTCQKCRHRAVRIIAAMAPEKLSCSKCGGKNCATWEVEYAEKRTAP